ncbi:MAG: hypothetical protein Q7K57_37300 [Burkholderiaceae bacterium]|nr:hypothetical protein [Burkholderiaceae bacterium]
MTASLLPATVDLSAFTQAELVSLVPDLYKEALNRFQESVTYRLTGPDPQPVFIPQIDPYGKNYRGLVLVPHGWPKTAVNP